MGWRNHQICRVETCCSFGNGLSLQLKAQVWSIFKMRFLKGIQALESPEWREYCKNKMNKMASLAVYRHTYIYKAIVLFEITKELLHTNTFMAKQHAGLSDSAFSVFQEGKRISQSEGRCLLHDRWPRIWNPFGPRRNHPWSCSQRSSALHSSSRSARTDGFARRT